LSISFLPLSEVDQVRVRELLVKMIWKRHWDEQLSQSYFSWRYGARGVGQTLVACDGGSPVGIIDSFIRPYWISGRRQLVRETCDWFCLPEYRRLGVGLHLMRRMMRNPEPIIVIGGTDDTQNLLPRLQWKRLPDLGNFILGISARTIVGLIAHRRWRRGIKVACVIPDVPLVRRVPHLAPSCTKSEVRVRALDDSDEAPKLAPYAIAPALDAELLNWLAVAPALLGQFLLLNFFCGGELVGISVNRLEKFSFGCISQIVHFHATSFDILDWMASATVHNLIERGVGVILCHTSCPTTASALSKLGFWRRKQIPAFCWPGDKLPQHEILHLSSLRADDALQVF
jgi:hypothetical protein